MAETIGLVASISALASTAVQVARLAKALNDLIERVHQVPDIDKNRERIFERYNRLGNSLAEWESRLRLESISGNEWGNRLPPESVPKVQDLISKMTYYYSDAQPRMGRVVYWASSSDNFRKLNVSGRIWSFPRREYEELSVLLNRLEEMNNQLNIIAPSLPSYSHVTDPPKDPNTVVHNISLGLETAAIAMKLSELFKELEAGLALLSHASVERALLTTILRRFRQWGNGLFEGPASIDVVLNGDDGSETTLRDVITRALVYIAAIEEYLLSHIDDQDNSIKQRLMDQRSNITALLGRGSLTAIVLDYWTYISPGKVGGMQPGSLDEPDSSTHPRQTVGKVTFNPKRDGKGAEGLYATDLEDLEQQTQELQIEVNDSISISRESETHGLQDAQESRDLTEDLIRQLSHIIDLLFDLTPTIRGLRRTYFLRTEEMLLKLRPKNLGGESQPTPTGPIESQRPSPIRNEKSQEERDMPSSLNRPMNIELPEIEVAKPQKDSKYRPRISSWMPKRVFKSKKRYPNPGIPQEAEQKPSASRTGVQASKKLHLGGDAAGKMPAKNKDVNNPGFMSSGKHEELLRLESEPRGSPYSDMTAVEDQDLSIPQGSEVRRF